MNEKPKILYVEDDETLSFVTKDNLEIHGYAVDHCLDGESAVESFFKTTYDLCILDVMLPKMDGFAVAEKIRSTDPNVPILFLTAKSMKEDRIQGLKLGADDYITKPFGVSELAARIKVALRHHEQIEGANSIFTSADLRVDLAKRSVERSGQTIKLTSTEFEVLRRLVLNAGRVVSQEFLLKDIWGKHALDNGHYLRIYIAHLRKKIETDPSNPKHIITEPGVGYRLL